MVAFLNAKISEKAAARGAVKLARLLKPEGLFVYQYLYGSPAELPAEYEVHRHFCAGWALRHVGGGLECDSSVPIAGEASIKAGLKAFTVPFGDDGHLCLVNNGKIEISVCGLALFATGSLSLTADDQDTVPIARAIGNYILSQRMANGDFIHIRDFVSRERLPLASEYSTAQALLGLFSLSRITGDSVWSTAALESLSKLASNRDVPLPRNHWVLYSLEQALVSSRDTLWYDLSKEVLAEMLREPIPTKGLSACWLACNCEAILTWFRMADALDGREPDRDLYDHAYGRLKIMLRKLLGFQLPDGAFVNEAKSKLVQIDFIHHAIVALFEFSRLARQTAAQQVGANE
jgi:hypothetical protein